MVIRFSGWWKIKQYLWWLCAYDNWTNWLPFIYYHLLPIEHVFQLRYKPSSIRTHTHTQTYNHTNTTEINVGYYSIWSGFRAPLVNDSWMWNNWGIFYGMPTKYKRQSPYMHIKYYCGNTIEIDSQNAQDEKRINWWGSLKWISPILYISFEQFEFISYTTIVLFVTL